MATIGTPLQNGGVVVQEQFFETGEIAGPAGVIPYDDTIPQNTEGMQVLSLTITPTNANNFLVVDTQVYGQVISSPGWATAALFRDSGVNALSAAGEYVSVGGGSYDISLSHSVLAGSTVPTTFKVRIGSSAGSMYMSGSSAMRYLGGVYNNYIRIREVSPNVIMPTGEIVGGLGVGQSWQDMTASRSVGTLYQNTGNLPIEVRITTSSASATGTGSFKIYSDAGTTVAMSDAKSYSTGWYASFGGIVPAGYYYELVSLPSSSVSRWSELR